jgi:hypothetical protein
MKGGELNPQISQLDFTITQNKNTYIAAKVRNLYKYRNCFQ